MTEQRIYSASQSTRIADARPQDFFACITQMAVGIGQNVPAPEAMLIMRQTLIDTMPWATTADIEMAVKMNMAKQLPEFVKPYGELSAAYLCEILTMYQSIRGKAVLKYRELEQRATQKQLTQREITDEDWERLIRQDAEAKKAGKEYWKFTASRMCQWLWDKNRINDNTFADAEWRAIDAEARARVMQSKEPPLTRGMVERMMPHQRDRFDMECLDEKKAIVYGKYLDAIGAMA